MAFSLQFYNVSDPPNKLDKAPGTQIASCGTVRPYEAVSELFGNFLIDYNAAINGCNYCYCPELNKYYYITDIQMETGSRMIVSVKVDVLKTYSADIKNMRIVAKRSSCIAKDNGNVGYNSYLEDGMWQIDSTALYWLSTDLFSGYFNYDYTNNGYILMTAG